MHHIYLITWFKNCNFIGLTDEICSQLIKSQLYTEKSNIDFLVKSSAKDHNSSKYVKMWNFFIKKSRIEDFCFGNLKFLNLEIFLIENFLFFLNFEPNFHHDARWFKGNFQYESCRSQWNLQIFFTQFLIKILGSQDIILWVHDHELKIT